MQERTFLMIKPDGVQQGLVGEIISRVEQKGFKIVALKMLRVDDETAKKHYAEHANKPFFNSLVEFIKSGPVVSMVIEGEDAISAMREMMGATDPAKAAPGTIRGDFAHDITHNIVHAADSPESAKREIGLYFEHF